MSECMSRGRSLYRLNDPEKTKTQGAQPIGSFDEAWAWNEKKWGVYWTVNEFSGRRVKENLKRIISWTAEIDGGNKPAMMKKIMNFIKPSAVIESKAGFHVYYDASAASKETWDTIVGVRLTHHLGGDKNAKDLCRILRVPAFRHWKNPDDPFAIKLVFWSDAKYTENEMMTAFPLPPEQEKTETQKLSLRRELKFQKDDSLFERIYSLDCEQALTRISGRACVSHEMFSFRRVSSGNKNILVNGKATSCWIDKNGLIGSSDHGGPTIWQWINWYQRDHRKTFEAIKEHFPELIDVK